MDTGYRITISRQDLLDYDIPVLENLLHRFMGVDKVRFNQVFRHTEVLAFDCFVSVDGMQEGLLVLEECGYKVRAEKLPSSEKINDCLPENGALGYPAGFVALTDDDCRVLLHSSPHSITKLARHKNLVVFGCCFTVFSAYLLMIYTSF